MLGSYSLDDEVPELSDGTLAVLGLSLSPRRTHDVAYLNLFGTSGRYTPAARGPNRGGALGRIGILFEAPGFGSVRAPLANDTDHTTGFAVGYHKFLNGGRRQVVLELAGRLHTRTGDRDGWGSAVRLQQALGRRLVLRIDLYGVSERFRGDFFGARSEFLIKF